ncbi:6194_t:CDS:2 [Scutellospora calospora]|uniref:6194_t:CDS:1 n=1 Tax=Scutellospora calospora TaxID=85575 RepID=A0ACA9JY60_9GLOM|nr:6194_t:CDS:2 [Scutellospora calospora]
MPTQSFFGTVLFEIKKALSPDSKYGLCQDCFQPNTNKDWCQSCNAERFRQSFSKWTSGNKHIDLFIQDSQVSAENYFEVVEWIPHDQLTKVTFTANGKNSTNYKAIWTNGDIIQWDHEKNDWLRCQGSINNWTYTQDKNGATRGSLTGRILRHYLQTFKAAIKNDSVLLPLFGITQHPKTSEYMIVSGYAEGGSLKNNLQYVRKLSWKKRLEILQDIAAGLAGIHQSDLLHRNLHSGNVLLFKSLNEKCDDNYSLIGDLGLPQPLDIDDKNIQLPIMQFQHADKIIQAQSKHSSNFYAPYYTNFSLSGYKTSYDNKKEQTRYY